MNEKIKQLVNLSLALFALTTLLNAQQNGEVDANITVEVDKPGHTISPQG